MSAQPAVEVQAVSKKFRLFKAPSHRLWEALHPFQKVYHQEFWALKDINLVAHRGETLGIIGRNGSGKSTLLQVICSVLRPTSGQVAVHGQVSALLELGAGFSQEFTGRDNVLFFAARNGRSPAQARELLPAVEEFADIGEFIDQPVKTYSSGMFIRLAFAAAIHIDPDILIVDEALAVGDAKFQYKCFQKFHEFQAAGKTILLVSHSTDAILRHCDRALLLDRGNLLALGDPQQVVNRYVDLLEEKDRRPRQVPRPANRDSVIQDGAGKNGASLDGVASGQPSEDRAREALAAFLADDQSVDHCTTRANYNAHEYRQDSPRAEICDFLVLAGNRPSPALIRSGERVELYLKARFHERVAQPEFGFSLKTVDGVMVYALNTFFQNLSIPAAAAGEVVVYKFTLDLPLAPGHYFFDLGVDERVGQARYQNLARRCAIAHLQVQETRIFHGLVDLGASVERVDPTETPHRVAA